ncbi:uncharacterized protein LOC108829834 [Raphanus sativus]|uniref:Uncharacterized protein LOC108829834 n=1 Tax=Raphanus sativus TaxID=3726 RepID=A0A6J0LFF0_RAPSA|nr:uncharacterized protein LOC108829834 [Raphanus sativus]
MTKSKRDGGLGFREIQSFNDALLAKVSWRILKSPTSLLARVLAEKYYHNQDFLTVNPPASCSHGWRGILIGQDLLKGHIGWAIGDGKSVLAWQDSWLLSEVGGVPMGPITEEASNMKVSDLFKHQSREWDTEKVDKHFPLISSSIRSIMPSKWGGADKRIWLNHASGNYSAKSGYYIALQKNNLATQAMQEPTQEWIKELWNVEMSPKLKLLIWKILHGALPVWNLVPFAGNIDWSQVSSFDRGWSLALKAIKRNFSAQETITKAICDAKEWKEAQHVLPPKNKKPQASHSSRIEVICRSDAAWKKETKAAGLAWTFSDRSNERFYSHTVTCELVISSLVAEGLAMPSAMEQAIDLQLKKVMSESDSLQLISSIKGSSDFAELHGILLDIHLLSFYFDVIAFRFSHQNFLAFKDGLAKQALRGIVPNPV